MDHRVDRVLYKLNWHGRYQLTQIALLCLSFFPASFNILSYVFLGYDGPHTCKEITNSSGLGMYSNDSISYGECEIVIQTNTSQGLITEHLECVAGNTYTQHKQVSIVSEWDLVCERAYMSKLTHTVFVLGQATGGLLCSSMSDRFGRKITLIFNEFILLLIGLVLSFSPNYAVYVIFRFLAGICQQGSHLTVAILILELVPTEKRFVMGTLASIMWGAAVGSLAPIAYLLRDASWRYLQLTIAPVSAYSVILPFTLNESLRWLQANGKTKETERILNKAAKLNNVSVKQVIQTYSPSGDNDGIKIGNTDVSLQVHRDVVDDPMVILDQKRSDVNNTCQSKEDQNDDDAEITREVSLLQDIGNGVESGHLDHIRTNSKATRKYTLLDILKNKLFFKNTVIVWYCWVVVSFVYFGLYMTSSFLAGNRYLNFFLNSVVDVPATLLMFLTIERFGRKMPLCIILTSTGISLLIAVLIKTVAEANHQATIVLSTILTLVGKLLITTAFSILFIYTPELFPTNLRNAGLGSASSAARLGGMVAPFVRTLEKKIAWAPGVLFTGMCLLAGFLIRFLPETRGHELPQMMEEVQEWYKTNLPSKKQKDFKSNKRHDDKNCSKV